MKHGNILLLVFILTFTAVPVGAESIVGEVPVVGTRVPVPQDTGVLEIVARDTAGSMLDSVSIYLYLQSGEYVLGASTLNGRLVLSNLKPEVYRVRARYRGWQEYKENVRVYAGVRNKVLFNSYESGVFGDLKVVVQDVSGNPVEGAAVGLWSDNWWYAGAKTTDVNGEAFYDDVDAVKYYVRASYGSWGENKYWFQVNEGGLTTVTFNSYNPDARGNLTVAVTDSMGSPVENARIRLDINGVGFVGEKNTDSNGVTEFNDLHPGSFSVRASTSDGWTEYKYPTVYEGQTTNLVFNSYNPNVTGILNITVTDVYGNPVDGARIRLYSYAWENLGDHYTSEDGVASLTLLAASPYTRYIFYVYIGNWSYYAGRWFNVYPGQTTEALVDAYNPTGRGSIKVVVSDTQGNRLENIKVNLYQQNPSLFITTLYTDSKGEVSFTDLIAGQYRLYAADAVSGWNEWKTQVPVISNEETTVVFNSYSPQRRGALRVYVKTTGIEPMEGVRVRLWNRAGGGAGEMLTDSDGKVEFTDLYPGDYFFRLYGGDSYPGWGYSSPYHTVVEDETTEVTVSEYSTLANATITVTVRTRQGQPLYNAMLRLEDGSYSLVETSYTSVENNGVVAFTSLHPGLYRIRASTEDGWAEYKSGINAVNGGNTEVVFDSYDSGSTGALRVVVSDGSGGGVEGARVRLYSYAWNLINGEQYTNTQGTVDYTGLQAGRYYVYVYVDDEGWSDRRGWEYVYAGETTTVPFVYNSSQTGNISVTVKSVNGLPVSGASVKLYSYPGGHLLSTLETDSQGKVLFTDLVSQSFRVYASTSDGWYENKYTQPLGAGETIEVVFNSYDPSDTGTLRITITDSNGNPLESARVTLYRSGFGTVGVKYADSNGVVEYADLLGGYYWFRISYSDWGYQSANYYVDGSTGVVEVVVSEYEADANGVVKATVNDVGGSPVEGASLRLQTSSYVTVGSKTTPASGVVNFTGLSQGSYHLRASKDGWVEYKYNIPVASDSTTSVVFDSYDSDLRGNLVVTVTTNSGSPMQGVRCRFWDYSWVRLDDNNLFTDAEGRCGIYNITEGRYTFRLYGETAYPGWGYHTGWQWVYNGQTTEVTVDEYNPDPSASITVTVQCASSAGCGGVEGATVRLEDGAYTVIRTNLTDSNGVIVFSGLHGGQYRLRAHINDGWVEYSSVFSVGVGEAKSYVFDSYDPAKAGSLKVVVRNASGGLVQGQRVRVYSYAWVKLGDEFTGGDGSVIFSGFVEGYYRPWVLAYKPYWTYVVGGETVVEYFEI